MILEISCIYKIVTEIEMGCGCNKSKATAVNYPKKKMIFKWTPKKREFKYRMIGNVNLNGNFEVKN